MRHRIITALLAAALTATPVAGFAATQTAAPAKPAAKPASTAATHSTRGVVKSIDASTLVITRPGANHPEMTFALNTSTHREGKIAVGVPVSIRYREHGKTHLATAVTVEPVK